MNTFIKLIKKRFFYNITMDFLEENNVKYTDETNIGTYKNYQNQ